MEDPVWVPGGYPPKPLTKLGFKPSYAAWNCVYLKLVTESGPQLFSSAKARYNHFLIG